MNKPYRSGCGFYSKRAMKLNGPPEGKPWVWLTKELLESTAFMSLSGHAMKALFRILIEHASHGGRENGRLPVTARDLIAYGLNWRRYQGAIRELEDVGLIRITVPGRRVCGPDKGAAPHYALTWLPIIEPENLTPPTNSWKAARPNVAKAERAGKVVRLSQVYTHNIEGVQHGGSRENTQDVCCAGGAGIVQRGRSRKSTKRCAEEKIFDSVRISLRGGSDS